MLVRVAAWPEGALVVDSDLVDYLHQAEGRVWLHIRGGTHGHFWGLDPSSLTEEGQMMLDGVWGTPERESKAIEGVL